MPATETDDSRGAVLALGLFRLGFFLPLLACTYLALIPDPPDNPVFRLGDVILHAAGFTYLSFALCLMLLDAGRPFRALAVRVFLVMLGYGVFLEVVQGFIPERTAEIKDLVVDALGIGLGLLLATVLARPLAGLVRHFAGRVVRLVDG